MRHMIDELPIQNFNTLKFHIDFFRDVIKHEEHNKMTAYNMAVTIGPNIFRPKVVKPDELHKAFVYYDLIIRMIENFDLLFDKKSRSDKESFDHANFF